MSFWISKSKKLLSDMIFISELEMGIIDGNKFEFVRMISPFDIQA